MTAKRFFLALFFVGFLFLYRDSPLLSAQAPAKQETSEELFVRSPGYQALQEKNYKQALSEIEKLMTLRNNDPYLFKMKGVLLVRLSRKSEGRKFLEKALERILKLSRDYQEQAECIYELGNIMLYRGNFEKALEHCNSALKIFENLRNKEGIGNTYNYLGGIFRKKKEYDRALSYFIEASKINKEIHDNRALAVSCVFAGQIYERKGNNQLAEKYYKEAFNFANVSGEIKEIKMAAEARYLFEKKMGKPQEAERSFRIFSMMKDSLDRKVDLKFEDDSKFNLLLKKINGEMDSVVVAEDPTSTPETEKFSIVIYVLIIGAIIVFTLFLILKRRN